LRASGSGGAILAVRHGLLLLLAVLLAGVCGRAQIDPVSRKLLQFGLALPVEGKSPLSAYAFYYDNHPGFLRTNLTLRLAVAPVYLDSELGIRGALGKHTDVGLGVAGGGFADSYFELRDGRFLESESFTGHAADFSLSVYHLFNPTPDGRAPESLGEVPLQVLLRVSPHYSWFIRDQDTAPNFAVPADLGSFSVRAGLRWGGREPLLVADRAVELSVWYEGMFRANPQEFGFNGDRQIRDASHQVWTRALAAYSFTNTHQTFELSVTGGAAFDADRLSAFRVGGALPLAGEFPLMVPGYYFQEFSARRFGLAAGTYMIGVPPLEHWSVAFTGSVARLEYLPGMECDRHWLTGLGGGIVYRSPSGMWQLMGGYGHGFQGKRSSGRGANAVSVLVQADMEQTSRQIQKVWQRVGPSTLQGLQGLFRR
jgi:hypothetical protein